jgi:uncharacterized membrane protein YbaN (DUF454 family)
LVTAAAWPAAKAGVFTPVAALAVAGFFFFNAASFFSRAAPRARAWTTGVQSLSATIGRSAMRTLAKTPAMA